MSENLKPCPFCGDIPEFAEIRGLTDQPMKLWHGIAICPLSETIVCSKSSKAKCIEYWNLRTPPPESPVKKCKVLLEPLFLNIDGKLPNEIRANGVSYFKNELVPLDFELVRIFFQDRWTYLENEVGASTTTLTIYRGLIEILQVVCSKFGSKPMPSENDIVRIIGGTVSQRKNSIELYDAEIIARAILKELNPANSKE